MFTQLKSIFRKLPSFSPRFHIAFGLSSLLTAVVLLAMFLGFVPDRAGAQTHGRIAFAEAVSSANSILLERGDLPGMRGSLEFIVQRNPDLNAVELQRTIDNNRVYFGLDEDTEDHDIYTRTVGGREDTTTSLVSGAIVTVPLLRGNQEWGKMHFQFSVPKKMSILEKLRNTTFSLMAFISVLSFPMFYFYLGKMLKELNPSDAVPARVRSALDTIAESLLVIDSRSNVVLANAAFAELNGGEAEELLGVKADTLSWIQSDPENPVFPWQQAFETAEPTRMDMVGYRDKSGEDRKFIVNCSPVMGAKGKVGGVLISMDDVTLLEEKELLLRQSMEEAEAANHAKTAFLSNMSHEIRTPMTAILGFTEVLKRNSNQSETDRLRHLNTISNSGTHLLELINDVLDLSKVESGAMEVESIPTKAAYISNEVVHTLQVKAKENELDLKIEIASALPEHILSDPSRLRQIVTNLVGNAIKFTESGGVTVRIDLLDDATDPRLQIAVVDTGIGMSEKQLSTIFEAFIQADASITRRFGGTGLGLSISRKLALAMQGDIVVTSKEGQGSTFMLTVPVGDISDVPMLSIDEVYESFTQIESVTQKTWTFPESHALVVDDGPENRELLSVVLDDLGINIETAENGKEGWDAAVAGNFDVILMDIQMPVMDGYEAVAAMRKSGITLPIVALTANAMKGYEQKVLSAGFSHYMTKPIDLDKLTALLAKLLNGTCVESDVVASQEVENDSLAEQASEQVSGQANEQSAEQTIESADTSPIYSSIAAQNPKFEAIAKQFVDRLAEKFDEMQQCLAADDFDELAKHAHWLKGSGGTVGFTQFAEPAKALEIAAKASDAQQCQTHLSTIKGLQNRIAFVGDGVGADDKVDGRADNDTALSENVTSSTESANDSIHCPAKVESSTEQADTTDVVLSSLPMSNPRFRAIVEKFMPRLEEQLLAIRKAFEDQDFEELASLAHWLKGSGGNVGFNGFTALALTLETSAKANDERSCSTAIEAVEKYGERVTRGWDTLADIDKSA